MKAFFKHFGSKSQISRKLPASRLRTIIEPFAGSAAYSVTRANAAHSVLLYDTDPRVCMIWDYLIHASSADIMRLPVQHFLDGGDIRELSLSQPEFLFVQRWLSRFGIDSAYRLAPSSFQQIEATWSFPVQARIAFQVSKIKHWKIFNESYARAPDIEAHWHIDPPYQSNARGRAEYKSDPLDYEALAQWCQARQGDVTVHEQHGANWLPFETLDSGALTGRTIVGMRQRAHEVYWKKDRMLSHRPASEALARLALNLKRMRPAVARN